MIWITSLSLTVKRTGVGLLACSLKMSGSKPKLKVRTLGEMFKKISESSEEKVWWYQRSNQKSYIEEQTSQWQK